MHLSIQRVVSARGTQEGINAFLFRHGATDWVWGMPPSTLSEANRMTFVGQRVSVQPPGNRVRSYLDVLAPDFAPPAVLQRYLDHFVRCHPPQALPATWHVGQGSCSFQQPGHGACWFSCGMENALIADWESEIRMLLDVGVRWRSEMTNAP